MSNFEPSETVKLFEQMENAVEVVSEEKKEDKPDIEAEDFNMEDYSGDDLSKLKKSKTKDIAKKVPDKQTKDDNMKGHGQANGAVKKTTTIESLHLCNDCCKTFRSINEKCTLCGSDKTELVIKVNEEGVLGRGTSDAAKDADVDQSDREYSVQRQRKMEDKKKALDISHKIRGVLENSLSMRVEGNRLDKGFWVDEYVMEDGTKVEVNIRLKSND